MSASSGCDAASGGRRRSCCSTEGASMQGFRVSVASLAVMGALVAGACRTTGDWKHPPNSPQGEDLKQYSVQESLEFYRNFFPVCAYYVFIDVPEASDRATGLAVYSFLILPKKYQRHRHEDKRPVDYRIIGSVRTADESNNLFNDFMWYMSSTP